MYLFEEYKNTLWLLSSCYCSNKASGAELSLWSARPNGLLCSMATVLAAAWGTEGHQHNVVRAHCLRPAFSSTSPRHGPREKYRLLVFVCNRAPCDLLQRAWRSTSVNLAKWRSAWWCGIPLPSGRGKKEACAHRPSFYRMPHALPCFSSRAVLREFSCH